MACAPAADTLEKIEARAGWAEAGTYADNEDNDCRAGPTAIKPPEVGAVVIPATIEDTAEDTPGSRVAGGLAEILDNKDETIGCTEAGNDEY